MSSSNGAVVGAGFGLSFESVAGKKHGPNSGPARANDTQALQREGATQLLIDVLRSAEMADRKYKVLVLSGFVRTTNIPLLSGFLPDEKWRGVRFRFRARSGRGWVLVLTWPDASADAQALANVAHRLKMAARLVTGEDTEVVRPSPSCPEVVKVAVDAVRSVQINSAWTGTPRHESFDSFVQDVCSELGEDEDPAYWKQALVSAQQQGFLHQGPNCFVIPVPTKPGPQPAKPEPPQVRKPEVTSAERIEALIQPPQDGAYDAAAVDLILEQAEAQESALKRMRALRNEVKDLENQVAQAQRKLIEKKQELAGATAQWTRSMAEAAQLVG